MQLIPYVLALLSLFAAPPPPSAYDTLKAQAEASYAEKSFRRAHELYEQAAKLELTATDRRWVTMRLADTAWRADAASPAADQTEREAARQALEALIREPEHDRVWAEANESLGDFWAMHPRNHNPHQAQQYWRAALDWWAGSDDLELARGRYLAIVWRMASASRWGSEEEAAWNVPRDVAVNALEIARTTQDRVHARYILAVQMLREQRPESVERAFDHLDAILAEGKATEWYDDALALYANQLAHQGAVHVDEEGRVTFRRDYAKALELYRRITSEFQKGQTRYWEHAQNMIREITEPSVMVMSGGMTYLPTSEQEIVVALRNVPRVELAIYAVDMTKDAERTARKEWTENISLEGRTPVRRLTVTARETRPYEPSTERVRLTPKLEPGAYVVAATSGPKTPRALLLISDVSLLIHAGTRLVDALLVNAITGEPVAGATVRAQWIADDNSQRMVTRSVTSGKGGLARIDVPANVQPYSVFFTAAAGTSRQAYHMMSTGYGGHEVPEHWRIYAFTDRPAYRPEETVQWKIIARTRSGDRWSTPAGQTIRYTIMNPRGEQAAMGRAKLNEFGSFWSELKLDRSMPLGEYVIQFATEGTPSEELGGAQLFRLEEYKLPEFQVSVSTGDKQYRLGDTIEAVVEATYYFGGPVANATVEAVIYEQPYFRVWHPRREFPWYYDDDIAPRHYRGDREMRRETLRTDAAGRATITIETPRDGQPRAYRIEARVVDASRREVRGSGTVRVLQQRYSVAARPQHFIHRPGEKVSVDFKAMDANDKPVQTTGNVRVLRRVWHEVWLDPTGRERTRDDYAKAVASTTIAPPGWRRRIAEYRDEEVMTTKVATDKNGEATFTFSPTREGYYVIQWSSEDRDPGKPLRANDLVKTETTVWVTSQSTTDLGYYSASGLDIIVDKESFREGETAPAMIVTPASGRWVALTTSATDILETQVFRLDGTVKLVQLPIDERHVPNFFLTASSIFDRQLATSQERVVVPPHKHFLDVEVKTDREQYEPRQEGTITVTTRDDAGKPVAAEVALSVSDESVTAIQQDLAGDPRAFFLGDTRQPSLQVGASVQSQPYVRLIENEKGELIDERVDREQQRRRGERKEELDALFAKDGAVGRDLAAGAVAPPPPPAMAPVAEAITVTAEAPMVETRAMAVGNAMGKVAAVSQAEVVVRSDFRSTALWQPAVVTGADGTARVTMKFPEALTTWRATARAVSRGMQVGMASSTSKTNLPLIVRLQAPRFFVVGDRATVSAVINNNTGAAVTVTPTLEVEGLRVVETQVSPASVAPNADARVDWTVVAERPGMATLRVAGRSATHGDAMERKLPVHEHGIDKLVARGGKLRGSEAIVKLELPRERRSTAMTVQIAPSLAVTMLDALPYLIDFPYGCTEQTMSRFLPAAIVARTLAAHDISRADVESRLFGGIENPKGKKNLGLLDDVTAKSMARLYDMQHGDGGWGWWKDGDSDPWMTAYVVWGFALARDAGLDVRADAVNRGVSWLDSHLVQSERDPHQQAWMLHAIAAWRRGRPNAVERKAFDNVWSQREKLTSYSRALFALAAHDFGDVERAKVLVRNLEDGVQIDRAPDESVLLRGATTTSETMATAHWGASHRFWWRWYDAPVETTAFALRALVRIEPSHQLIEPVMNWLVKNRRGAQWSNTRDTAVAVLALNDYLQASRELEGELAYEVTVNGRAVASRTIPASELLRAPSRFPVPADAVRDGVNEIRIRRTAGSGPIYFAAEARFFSLEEPIKAAGNELFVRREYFRLVPKPTLLKGVTYDKVPLRDGESIASNDRVEVVVTVETKNDYEYLVFEDLKPAGFEAVELQSGTPLYAQQLRARRTVWVYQELRDRHVALFIDKLPQGIWEIRYTLRAETPGSYHALPLLGHAMYVPEIRANGDEVRVEVR